MTGTHFIVISDNGHRWVFLFDDDLRSMRSLFDVLIAYEHDQESGFERCHANQVLDALGNHLHAIAASRQTVAT